MKLAHLFFLLVSTAVFGQMNEARIPVEGTLIFTGQTSVLPIANSVEGGFSFLKVDRTELQAYRVDQNGETTASMIIDIPKDLGNFLDAIHINGTLRLFFTKKDAVGYMDLDFENATTDEVIINDVFDKSQRLIGYYGENNKFYTVTIKEDSSIVVNVFSEEEGYESIEFVSENDSFTENYLAQKLFSKKSLINIVKMGEESSFTLNFNPKKLYVSENKIIITIDYYRDEEGADHVTDIIELDLAGTNVSSYTIEFPKITKTRSVKKEIQSRSYVKEGLLFQFVHTKDQLIVQIVDYKTGAVKNKFSMDEFTNGLFSEPEIVYTPEYGVKEPNAIKKNKRFFRNLYQNQSAINVYKENGSYLIKIGAFELPEEGHRMDSQVNNSPGMVTFSAAPIFPIASVTVFLTIMIVDGVSANPPNYGTTNSIYLNEKELNVVSASVAVNSTSFEVEKNTTISSVYQRSRAHEKKLIEDRVRLVKPSLFKIRDVYYFSYFSVKDRSFIISTLP